jgi:hypothetical protein
LILITKYLINFILKMDLIFEPTSLVDNSDTVTLVKSLTSEASSFKGPIQLVITSPTLTKDDVFETLSSSLQSQINIIFKKEHGKILKQKAY